MIILKTYLLNFLFKLSYIFEGRIDLFQTNTKKLIKKIITLSMRKPRFCFSKSYENIAFPFSTFTLHVTGIYMSIVHAQNEHPVISVE
jgi:hypothetical protein